VPNVNFSCGDFFAFLKKKERERNKTLKVHEKLTTNAKLLQGMKAGLKPDISDDEQDNVEVREPVTRLSIILNKIIGR
jgi:hypothetical protein